MYLNRHSYFSYEGSSCSIEELVETASTTSVLTDMESLDGWLSFIHLNKINNKKTVIGYMTRVNHSKMTLFPKNKQGLKQILAYHQLLGDTMFSNKEEMIAMMKGNIILTIPFETLLKKKEADEKDFRQWLRTLKNKFQEDVYFEMYEEDRGIKEILKEMEMSFYYDFPITKTSIGNKKSNELYMLQREDTFISSYEQFEESKATDHPVVDCSNKTQLLSRLSKFDWEGMYKLNHLEDVTSDLKRYKLQDVIATLEKKLNEPLLPQTLERLEEEWSQLHENEQIEEFYLWCHLFENRTSKVLIKGKSNFGVSLLAFAMNISDVNPLLFNLPVLPFEKGQLIEEVVTDEDFHVTLQSKMKNLGSWYAVKKTTAFPLQQTLDTYQKVTNLSVNLNEIDTVTKKGDFLSVDDEASTKVKEMVEIVNATQKKFKDLKRANDTFALWEIDGLLSPLETKNDTTFLAGVEDDLKQYTLVITLRNSEVLSHLKSTEELISKRYPFTHLYQRESFYPLSVLLNLRFSKVDLIPYFDNENTKEWLSEIDVVFRHGDLLLIFYTLLIHFVYPKVYEEERYIILERLQEKVIEEEPFDIFSFDKTLDVPLLSKVSFSDEWQEFLSGLQGLKLREEYLFEYIEVLLNNAIRNKKHEQLHYLVGYCMECGLSIQAPKVNQPSYWNVITNQTVHLGSGIWVDLQEDMKKIVSETVLNGRYRSFEEFVTRNIKNGLKRTRLQQIINTGYLDELDGNRIDKSKQITNLYTKNKNKTNVIKGQTSFLQEEVSGNETMLKRSLLTQQEELNLLSEEIEQTGFYLEENPLLSYENQYLFNHSIQRIGNLKKVRYAEEHTNIHTREFDTSFYSNRELSIAKTYPFMRVYAVLQSYSFNEEVNKYEVTWLDNTGVVTTFLSEKMFEKMRLFEKHKVYVVDLEINDDEIVTSHFVCAEKERTTEENILHLNVSHKEVGSYLKNLVKIFKGNTKVIYQFGTTTYEDKNKVNVNNLKFLSALEEVLMKKDYFINYENQ